MSKKPKKTLGQFLIEVIDEALHSKKIGKTIRSCLTKRQSKERKSDI